MEKNKPLENAMDSLKESSYKVEKQKYNFTTAFIFIIFKALWIRNKIDRIVVLIVEKLGKTIDSCKVKK